MPLHLFVVLITQIDVAKSTNNENSIKLKSQALNYLQEQARL
jgi:hypothetical protein